MSADEMPSDLMPSLRTIAVAWALVALAYTPALMMSSAGEMNVAAAFVFVLLGFLPWMLATRLLLSVAWRAPLGAGTNGRSLGTLLVTGCIALPLLSFAGSALGQTFGTLVDVGRLQFDPGQVVRSAMITGFFSVPTFVAVMGVGQTIVYIDRTRTRERLLARARLDALRAQIDPHFLFNALGGIAQLAHRDAERAESAIVRLADVLRSSLTSDQGTVPLSDEIGTMMHHLELHRMLLPAPVDLRLAIDPGARQAEVPAMILQPLVENAVTHGLSRMSSGLWLSVTAKVEAGRLTVRVSNARPVANESPAGLGLGLRNVRERLTASYGVAGKLNTSNEDGRFDVEIELPFTEAPERRP